VRRDPNVLLGGTAYALTVILAIRPGCEQLLRRRIRAWKKRPVSPFARLPNTHFARLVVLDRLVFEGPEERRPEISLQYLLFSATFDGDSGAARDRYLERMCERLPAEVESVFGLCAGAPCPVAENPARFRDWLVSNQLKVSAFYAHSPTAKVRDVRRARALRRRVRAFALRNPYERPRVLKKRFDKAFPR
jgi:hypothetical protein